MLSPVDDPLNSNDHDVTVHDRYCRYVSWCWMAPHIRRRISAGGVSGLARNLPPPMIVARHRGTTVSSHEAARVVFQVSERPILGNLWFGTGFLRFLFGTPI